MISLTNISTKHPKTLMYGVLVICLMFVVLVATPSLAPQFASVLNPLKIDTDPENMLSYDEPVRVFHREQKKKFNLHDIVVVGVVDSSSPAGAFTSKTLTDVYNLTEYAKTLTWQKDGEEHGLISVDVMAPSTVDNIEQAGLGSVSFSWLMDSPPKSDQEALAIAQKAKNLPLLNDTLVSEKGNALALYLPIRNKSDSYEIAEKLREHIATFDTTAQYHITGLPIAQDQFGIEMFVQMAISAPMAMLLIFALMWYFFRHVGLIISPMLVAMASVIITMGALVVTGNTVHIMSSMIPIFIMPIAVLDAIHILSDFFDRYQKTKDRKKTLNEVMHELSAPMLFTSLTTFAGFISLAVTPIPPVQVFGIFVALGVVIAWLLTITMIPAYIMLMPEEKFKNFGLHHSENEENSTLLAKLLKKLGSSTYYAYKFILIGVLALGVGAYFGITKIEINDNPVKWFAASHPIRVADKELNERFGGTYMAYLSLSAPEKPIEQQLQSLKNKLLQQQGNTYRQLAAQVPTTASSMQDALSHLQNYADAQMDNAETDNAWEEWDNTSLFLSQAAQSDEIFKDPAILEYISTLQDYLLTVENVGKVNSVVDIVKTVHRELMLGDPQYFNIPDSRNGIAQTLISFQNSHKPDDLWHFVTPDYKNLNLWIQLQSGDNKDMKKVVEAVDLYIKNNPIPEGISANWFGLTYINVIWQDKMVSGMMESFLGSFLIVLVLMALLFRSLLWGALAMIPLTFTIAAIYGIIGWIGKDYDMPVAVLSSLSLGLAVDYAIHFLARSRFLFNQFNNWKETSQAVFGEPARAITRNVIVLGVGFLPLLAAPLVPYNTVGIFISAILLLAGIATLVILPACIRLLEPFLFKKKK